MCIRDSYNTVASKWQFLNAFKDNTLGADTAGEYLLTTENLRFAEMLSLIHIS